MMRPAGRLSHLGPLLLGLALMGVQPAAAQPPVKVGLLTFADGRKQRSPGRIPSNVDPSTVSGSLAAYPKGAASRVRGMVKKYLAGDPRFEVVDLSHIPLPVKPASLAADPKASSTALIIGGKVFHYEGTFRATLFGDKSYTGFVGYELFALHPTTGRFLVVPVAFAALKGSGFERPEEGFGPSDWSLLEGWIGKAVKATEKELPARLPRNLLLKRASFTPPGAKNVLIAVPLAAIRPQPAAGVAPRAAARMGVTLPVVQHKGYWYGVRLPDGSSGWVLFGDAVPIKRVPNPKKKR